MHDGSLCHADLVRLVAALRLTFPKGDSVRGYIILEEGRFTWKDLEGNLLPQYSLWDKSLNSSTKAPLGNAPDSLMLLAYGTSLSDLEVMIRGVIATLAA